MSALNTIITVAAVGVGGYFLYNYIKKAKPPTFSMLPSLFLGGSSSSSSSNSFINDLSNVLGNNVNPGITQGETNSILNNLSGTQLDQVLFPYMEYGSSGGAPTL